MNVTRLDSLGAAEALRISIKNCRTDRSFVVCKGVAIGPWQLATARPLKERSVIEWLVRARRLTTGHREWVQTCLDSEKAVHRANRPRL